MTTRFKFLMVSVLTLGVAGSFNGCTCNGEAKVGDTAPKTPPPPPPPPPMPVAATPPPPPPAPAPPAPAKAKLEGTKVSIPGELEFEFDKATIKDTAGSRDILNTLVEFLGENPQVTKLRIEGHTDNVGTADHNLKLSQERADAVATWLVGHGIPASRLTTKGYGQTKPLVANDTDEHKAMNRRTVFHVAALNGADVPAEATPAATPAAAGAAKKAEKATEKKPPAK